MHIFPNPVTFMYHCIVKIKKIVDLSFSKLSFKVASAYILPQSSNICLQKVCDEVFLNSHICSLDRQCRGKNMTKFS